MYSSTLQFWINKTIKCAVHFIVQYFSPYLEHSNPCNVSLHIVLKNFGHIKFHKPTSESYFVQSSPSTGCLNLPQIIRVIYLTENNFGENIFAKHSFLKIKGNDMENIMKFREIFVNTQKWY